MPRSMCSSIPKPKLPIIIIKLSAKQKRRRATKTQTESRLTVVWEVFLSKFELLDLETTLDQFFSLGAADSDMNGDLFVSLDAESSDSVSGAGLDGLLVGEILEHLSGLCQLISRFTSAEIEYKLLNLDFSHLVFELLLLLLSLHIFFLSLLNLIIISNTPTTSSFSHPHHIYHLSWSKFL